MLYRVFSYFTDENSLQIKVLLMYKRSIIVCLVCTREDTGYQLMQVFVCSFLFAEIEVGNWESVPCAHLKGERAYGYLRFTHTGVTPSAAMDVIFTEHALQHLHFFIELTENFRIEIMTWIFKIDNWGYQCEQFIRVWFSLLFYCIW